MEEYGAPDFGPEFRRNGEGGGRGELGETRKRVQNRTSNHEAMERLIKGSE